MMNPLLRSLLVLCMVLFSAKIYAAGWEVLTGTKLESAFADKTIIGKRYVVYYDGSGRMRGKWGGKTYTGRYYFKDGVHYCSTWDQHDSGGEEEGCWTVEKKKKKLRIKPVSGRPTRTQTLKTKEGNVEGI